MTGTPWWLWFLAVIGALASITGIVSLFFALGRRPNRMWTDQIGAFDTDEFLQPLAALLNVPDRAGGRATLLNNGDAFLDDMLAAFAGARRSINFMFYIWEPGTMSDRVFAALHDSLRAGVQVRILLDGLGCIRCPRDDLDRIREAGARIEWFRPPRLGALTRFHRRNHRRAIVVDGRIGYTGGEAVGDKWLGNARNPDEWRDSMTRLDGEFAGNLQSAFAELWASATGEVLTGDSFFPTDLREAEQAVSVTGGGSEPPVADHAAARAGDHSTPDGIAAVDGGPGLPASVATPVLPGATAGGQLHSVAVNSSPSSEEHPLRLFFFLSFVAARERIWITTPYFVPDKHTREVVKRRARAGVDVRIMMPNELTDAKPIRKASHSYYSELLNAGIRIYEYQTTMMHAKHVVIDGKWSIVGSANMDIRSKELNEENVVGILDAAFAEQLEASFVDDLEHCIEIDRVAWRRRGIGARIIERICVLFAEQY
jgi:cardiolipin synthase A/B